MQIIGCYCVYQANTGAKCFRREYFLSEKNSVATEHDYYEISKGELYMEIQSEKFVFNLNISIESSTSECHNKYHYCLRN